MSTPETISEAIDENARGPKRVQVGNQSVEAHPIQDQIAADRYAKGESGTSRNHMGLRFMKIIPPGAG